MRARAGVLVLAAAVLGGGCTPERVARAACVGQTDCRPPLVVTTLDGVALGEEVFRGKVTLVNFWATWCGPCVHEMPALEQVYERHHAEGFVIVGVVTGDSASDVEVKAFAARHAVVYPLVRGGAELERRFGMGEALPTSVLYDRSGKLVRRWEGGIAEGALETLVKQAL